MENIEEILGFDLDTFANKVDEPLDCLEYLKEVISQGKTTKRRRDILKELIELAEQFTQGDEEQQCIGDAILLCNGYLRDLGYGIRDSGEVFGTKVVERTPLGEVVYKDNMEAARYMVKDKGILILNRGYSLDQEVWSLCDKLEGMGLYNNDVVFIDSETNRRIIYKAHKQFIDGANGIKVILDQELQDMLNKEE